MRRVISPNCEICGGLFKILRWGCDYTASHFKCSYKTASRETKMMLRHLVSNDLSTVPYEEPKE